jgi:hypothetical protein
MHSNRNYINTKYFRYKFKIKIILYNIYLKWSFSFFSLELNLLIIISKVLFSLKFLNNKNKKTIMFIK